MQFIRLMNKPSSPCQQYLCNKKQKSEVKKMSPKELLYIEDSLGHCQQIKCLCADSENSVTDPELKQLISSIAQKQSQSFSRFYGLLNG